MKTYTVAQVAERLGRNPRSVSTYCARHGIGTLLTTRLRLLTEADIKRVAGAKPGKRAKA